MSLSVATIPRLGKAGDLELAARGVLQGVYAGRHRSPYLGSSVEFADHRPYQAGDDLRSVDWKAFARSDQLLVRRYREERDLPLVLCCDTSASMRYGEPEKRAWMQLAAAVLGLLAIDQGDRVRLAGGAELLSVFHPDRGGPVAAEALCHHLDQLPEERATDLPRLLDELGTRLERRALIVLFSDLLEDPAPLARVAAGLRSRGHELVVLQILDRSERELPAAWEQVALTDPEGRVEGLSCDARRMKADYDRSMRVHLADCRRRLAGARVEHLLVTTDAGHADVLGGWLRRRRRR